MIDLLASDLDTEPAKTVPPAPKVTCGIDPGSSHLGVSVISVDGSLLHAEKIEVGHDAYFTSPVVTTRKDGSQVVREKVREIDEQDTHDLWMKLRQIWDTYRVERVVIEWVEHAFLRGSDQGKTSIATHLARAQWVGGLLAGSALSLGLDVAYVTSKRWTSGLTKKTQKGRRGVVAEVVEARYPEVIGKDEHSRDAIGIVMWDRLRFAAPPSPRQAPPTAQPAEGEEPKPRVKRDRVRRGQVTPEKIRRAEAGCTCTSPRHRVGCVLYQAIEYRKDKGNV